MPELPEVETTRRFVAPELVGRVIVAVDVRRPRMVRRQVRPVDFADRLTGQRITRLRRHGKFMLADIEGGIVWVTHLGMSGRVQIASSGEREAPHTNVVVTLDSGREFRLVDPRMFGFVAAYTPDEYADSTLMRLGPDAFESLPSSRELAQRLARRTAPIKPLLLDQGIIAGLGNIYADETLYRARLSPYRPGGDLDFEEVKRLRAAIKTTLAAGLRWGGTSLDDLAYLLPDGRAGEFLHRLRVYGREDEPCRRCGTPIRRAVLRGRSTHFCPGCQQ
jgi:formamidopyrimidine-DNA glycosylase